MASRTSSHSYRPAFLNNISNSVFNRKTNSKNSEAITVQEARMQGAASTVTLAVACWPLVIYGLTALAVAGREQQLLNKPPKKTFLEKIGLKKAAPPPRLQETNSRPLVQQSKKPSPITIERLQDLPAQNHNYPKNIVQNEIVRKKQTTQAASSATSKNNKFTDTRSKNSATSHLKNASTQNNLPANTAKPPRASRQKAMKEYAQNLQNNAAKARPEQKLNANNISSSKNITTSSLDIVNNVENKNTKKEEMDSLTVLMYACAILYVTKNKFITLPCYSFIFIYLYMKTAHFFKNLNTSTDSVATLSSNEVPKIKEQSSVKSLLSNMTINNRNSNNSSALETEMKINISSLYAKSKSPIEFRIATPQPSQEISINQDNPLVIGSNPEVKNETISSVAEIAEEKNPSLNENNEKEVQSLLWDELTTLVDEEVKAESETLIYRRDEVEEKTDLTISPRFNSIPLIAEAKNTSPTPLNTQTIAPPLPPRTNSATQNNQQPVQQTVQAQATVETRADVYLEEKADTGSANNNERADVREMRSRRQGQGAGVIQISNAAPKEVFDMQKIGELLAGLNEKSNRSDAQFKEIRREIVSIKKEINGNQRVSNQRMQRIEDTMASQPAASKSRRSMLAGLRSHLA